jgi:hypothetical protein
LAQTPPRRFFFLGKLTKPTLTTAILEIAALALL